MLRADLRDSDSFFENEMESDVEQTLIAEPVGFYSLRRAGEPPPESLSLRRLNPGGVGATNPGWLV
jgi:hypothetical protein